MPPITIQHVALGVAATLPLTLFTINRVLSRKDRIKIITAINNASDFVESKEFNDLLERLAHTGKKAKGELELKKWLSTRDGKKTLTELFMSNLVNKGSLSTLSKVRIRRRFNKLQQKIKSSTKTGNKLKESDLANIILSDSDSRIIRSSLPELRKNLGKTIKHPTILKLSPEAIARLIYRIDQVSETYRV